MMKPGASGAEVLRMIESCTIQPLSGGGEPSGASIKYPPRMGVGKLPPAKSSYRLRAGACSRVKSHLSDSWLSPPEEGSLEDTESRGGLHG